MRSLFLLRHGKSDWDTDYRSDHERPLKKRGRKAAVSMGELLSGTGCAPDLVLTSSAVRARVTAELALVAGGWECGLEVLSDLYGAGPTELIALVREHGHDHERVLVVGHEPTLSETVAALTGGGPPAFPTAALARIEVPIATWNELAPGTGHLHWLIPPKVLGRKRAR